MHSLAERVLSHLRRQDLLSAGERVGVAVSGGIDSVALLRLLLELRGELGIVLIVVHFNHKLRGAESDADERFVAELAREHRLEFYADSDDVAQHAAQERTSVETAARELRYGFFRHLLAEDGDPQGLKPDSEELPPRGPKGPLFHSMAESRPFSRTTPSEPTSSSLDKVATGHSLDDQAETVLMRMIRGAGLRGLGGIHPRIEVEDEDGELCGEIVRPLLTIRRRELEQYLGEIGQDWREDSTNTDAAFTRNRVRKLVLPLLEKEFNPAVAESLAELAEIARGEEDYWENEVAGWMGTAVQWAEPGWARVRSGSEGLVQIAKMGTAPQELVSMESPTLRPAKTPTSRAENAREMGHPGIDDLQSRMENAPWLVMDACVDRVWFLGEPTAVQRRVVKAIGEQAGIPLEFRHVEQILRLAEAGAGAGKELALPLGWIVQRDAERLVFLTPDLRAPALQRDYEYDLPVPGTVVVHEVGSEFEVQRIPGDARAGYNPDHLLDAESLPGLLRVRNWRPGDRFWPAHTKSPKKIKELLQERHVALPGRRLWPVVVSGNEIVWVRGFPSPAKLRARPGRDAVFIGEKPLGEKAAM